MTLRSKPLKNKGQNPNHDVYNVPSHGQGVLNGGNANKYYTNVKPYLAMISQWIEDGKTDKQIYRLLDISESSWYRYKEEQEELQEIVRDGKSVLVMKLEKKMYEKILNCEKENEHKHDALHMFALKKNSPDKYNDKNDKREEMPLSAITIVTKDVSMSKEDREAVVSDME